MEIKLRDFSERESMGILDLCEQLHGLYNTQRSVETAEDPSKEVVLASVREDIDRWIKYLLQIYPSNKAYAIAEVASRSSVRPAVNAN